MSRVVRGLCAAIVLSVCAGLAGSASTLEETFGKGVSLKEATPIASLYETPAKFVGKTVRIDGVVSAVCEEMGCWMALADSSDPSIVVRFKVDHGKGIVFPVAAKGKTASAEGVFEKISASDTEAQEAAAEHAAASLKAEAFGKSYQIKATGAVIK